MYSGLTRYRNVMKPTDKPLRLMERSVFSERYCFLEAGHAANHKVGGKGITDPEYLLMTKWFKLLTEQLWSHLKPDLICKFNTYSQFGSFLGAIKIFL